MKHSLHRACMAHVVGILFGSLVVVPALCQQIRPADPQASVRAQYQEKLKKIAEDKSGYASAIVERWEEAARSSGRWDKNYAADLHGALMKLSPANLILVGDAPTFPAMMYALATGKPLRSGAVPEAVGATSLPAALGDITDDLVYTPVTPCRIVDTRVSGGALANGETRDFDVDGTDLSAQGGSATGCGIPYGVAWAVAMTMTATQAAGNGYFTAWSVGASKTTSSVLNYQSGVNVANTTIVPVWPGAGDDFCVYAYKSTQVVIDVLGYYAAPVATPVNCTTVNSADTPITVGPWTNVDISCPTGTTAAGGGFDTPSVPAYELPDLHMTSLPLLSGNGWRTWVVNTGTTSLNVTTYCVCCHIPGR